jgi:hypothetical protein
MAREPVPEEKINAYKWHTTRLEDAVDRVEDIKEKRAIHGAESLDADERVIEALAKEYHDLTLLYQKLLERKRVVEVSHDCKEYLRLYAEAVGDMEDLVDELRRLGYPGRSRELQPILEWIRTHIS